MAINRDKILREAEKLVQRGRVDQAIKEYEKLLEANPNDANTINRVGDLYGRIGQVERAIELYERIADYFTQDGFTTKAIAILKKINRLAPQRLDIFGRLAELYVQQGLLVEAKAQYQMLADWFVRNGDLKQAIEAHRKLVQLDPANHMANLRLADLLLQVGQAEDALQAYGRLGRMLLQRGKLDEAERLYRHALGQNPPTGEFLAPLLEALLDSGRGPTASEFLAAALKRSPGSTELRMLEVRSMAQQGDARKALERSRELLAADPDNADLRSLVGRVLLDSGEAVKARDLLLPVAEKALGRGDFRGAQQMLQGLLKAMPQDQQLLVAALKAFEPSGEREMLFTLRAALADSLFRSGQGEGAQRLYMELLSDQPDNPLFRQRLAQLEGVAPSDGPVGRSFDAARLPAPGEEDEVIEFELPDEAEFESVHEQTYGALDLDPTEAAADVAPFDPQERLAEANVFAKYGLVDKAIHQLEDILRYCPDHVVVRAKLVDLYLEGGQNTLAREVGGPLLEHYDATGDRDAFERLRSLLPAEAGGVEAPDDEGPILLIELEEEVAADFSFEGETPTALAAEDARFEVEELPDPEAPFGETPDGGPPPEEEPEIEVIELPLEVGDALFAREGEAPDLTFELEPAVVEEVELPPVEVDAFEPEPVEGVERAVDPWGEGATASEARLEGAPEPGSVPKGPPAVEVAPVRTAPAETPAGPPAFEEPAAAPAESHPHVRSVSARAAADLADLERSLLGPPAERPPRRAATRPAGPAAADLVDSLFRGLPFRPAAPRPATPAPPVDVEPGQPQRPAVPAAHEEEFAPSEVAPAPVFADAPAPPAAVEASGEVEVLGEELVEITESLGGPAVSDLQQVDFFIEQELYEDAIRMLDALQREFPDDPEVAERRAALKAKGLLVDEGGMAGEGAEELFADEEDYFDLAKELEEELAREEAMVEEATGRGKDEALLEEVFREFQKGVAEQLSEEDSDTHFNLGIAYKEMGLLPEAIREFQISSRDPKYYIESCSMIGVCYIEQGMADQGAEWYRKAMDVPDLSSDATLALRYDLASALEMAGDLAEAYSLFESVAAADPRYRDVAERISVLAEQRQAN